MKNLSIVVMQSSS